MSSTIKQLMRCKRPTCWKILYFFPPKSAGDKMIFRSIPLSLSRNTFPVRFSRGTMNLSFWHNDRCAVAVTTLKYQVADCIKVTGRKPRRVLLKPSGLRAIPKMRTRGFRWPRSCDSRLAINSSTFRRCSTMCYLLILNRATHACAL